MFIFYQGSSNVSQSRTSSLLFTKLEETHNYPCILVLVKRYQIPFLSNSSGIFSSVRFNDLRQECFSGSQDRENVKERSNKNCSTRSNLHSQLNICSSQNGITVLPIVKPENLNQYTYIEMVGLFLLKTKM